MSTPKVLEMTHEEWKQFIRQTDIMETEVLAQASDGKLAKTILRKSARQVDQGVSWTVYKRDNYTCRYCGLDGIPMTVDHLVLWEDGGPSIEENLLTSCRKCNKLRGSEEYELWLENADYNRFNKLSDEVLQANVDLIKTLPGIPVRVHKVSR